MAKRDRYFELIVASLSESARRYMLDYLNVHRYQYQDEEARKYIDGGRREVLVKQLALRFGELPAWALHRLIAADDADLTRWTESVLTAATLDAVFAGPAPAARSSPTAWNVYEDFVGMCMKAGRVGGQQHILAKLLGLKFGEVPEWALSHLRLALEPALEHWTERVLTAATLDEVFAE